MSSQSLWFPYAQMRGLEIQNHVVSAQGVRLHLRDGRTLIDGVSSWWSVIHGYAHPDLDKALADQAKAFAHVMLGGLTHSPAQDLADTLVAKAPLGLEHVFFADSGSVGMEVAMKMAIQYWRNMGVKGRNTFLSLRHAYHGDTTGVMSLGDPEEGMHRRFGDYLPKQLFTRPPEGAGNGRGEIKFSLEQALDELRTTLQKHAPRLAAMVCEPLLQAAGGFNMYPVEYLQAARTLCNAHDVLLICDEVATGFGRTGTLFACEQAGITPDIMVLGKGLSAGYLGLSATLTTHRIFAAFLGDHCEFLHGPTFMGNALACSVAQAGLRVFQRDQYLKKISRIEAILKEELLEFKSPRIRETRVWGATGVIEVHDGLSLQGLSQFAGEQGVWLRPFDKVAYTMPAYVIDEPDLRQICKILRAWFALSR